MPADEFALTGLLVVAYEVLHVPRLAKVEAYVTAEGFELVELLFRSCRPLMQLRASTASMWHTSNHATAIRAARSFSSGDASAGVISACFASIARRHWRDGVRSRVEFGEGDSLADPAMAIEGR